MMATGRHKIHSQRALKGAVLLLMLFAASLSQAQTAHQQLHDAVSHYIESFFNAAELSSQGDAEGGGRRVEIEVSNIDPRLPIAPCEQALVAQINQNQQPVGRLNVRVDCHGSAPWSKYVPAQVRVYEQVLITTRPLTRGDIISASDIMLREADTSTLRNAYMQTPELALGMEVRRTLQANVPVVREALAAPILVRRGDAVIITAQTGTIEIRQQGTALQNGEMGTRITVRNNNSNIVVQAIVTGHGQAQVGF
jgi:flagella basal body P-ring formation protein FlgA